MASNGLEGRRIIDNDHPALVITDMMMPKMGGFPVLEYIRSQPSPPRVIMITANEGGRHKAYAEMLGVDEYLRKPFAMDVLLEAVERIIGSGEERGSQSAGRLAAQTDAHQAHAAIMRTEHDSDIAIASLGCGDLPLYGTVTPRLRSISCALR